MYSAMHEGIILHTLQSTHTHTHTNADTLSVRRGRTIGVGGLTECEEVDDGVVHLQHGGALPVHHGETGPPAHRVVGQTPGQDHEGLPAGCSAHTHTHTRITTRTHTHTRTHQTHKQTQTHTQTHTHTKHTHTHKHTHTKHTHRHKHTHTKHTHRHKHTHIRKHVHTHTHTNIRIQTHTQTQTLRLDMLHIHKFGVGKRTEKRVWEVIKRGDWFFESQKGPAE